MHSNYNKVSETSMPVDEVEAWLNEFEHKRVENKPNHGIIRSTESVIFVSGTRANMTKKERKAAIAQAQREHKAAMRELAIQERKDQTEIARKRKLWAKEIKAIRPEPSKPKLSIVEARQNALEAQLRAGESITTVSPRGATKNQYQTMHRDIMVIKNRFDCEVVRIRLLNNDIARYTLDTIETFDGDINYSDMDSILSALKTKKAIRLNGTMYQQEVKNLASIIRKLDNVTGIYNLSGKLKGWVIL